MTLQEPISYNCDRSLVGHQHRLHIDRLHIQAAAAANSHLQTDWPPWRAPRGLWLRWSWYIAVPPYSYQVGCRLQTQVLQYYIVNCLVTQLSLVPVVPVRVCQKTVFAEKLFVHFCRNVLSPVIISHVISSMTDVIETCVGVWEVSWSTLSNCKYSTVWSRLEAQWVLQKGLVDLWRIRLRTISSNEELRIPLSKLIYWYRDVKRL